VLGKSEAKRDTGRKAKVIVVQFSPASCLAGDDVFGSKGLRGKARLAAAILASSPGALKYDPPLGCRHAALRHN